MILQLCSSSLCFIKHLGLEHLLLETLGLKYSVIDCLQLVDFDACGKAVLACYVSLKLVQNAVILPNVYNLSRISGILLSVCLWVLRTNKLCNCLSDPILLKNKGAIVATPRVRLVPESGLVAAVTWCDGLST